MNESDYIYIITHKRYEFKVPSGYKTILVGAEKNNNFKNKYLLDNIGDNISLKNDSYCELTGLYWLWKNVTAEKIGVVHYRRYFAKIKKLFVFRGRYITLSRNPYTIYDSDTLFGLLNDYDFVVKQSEYRKKRLKDIFICLLGTEIWSDFRNVVRKKNPDYMEAFGEMENSHTHFNCNMLVTKKDLFNGYCGFIFSIIDEMDKLHIQKTGDRYHNREMGYFGEFLLGVWIKKNMYKYKICEVVNIGSKDLVGSVLYPNEFIKFLFRKMKGSDK